MIGGLLRRSLFKLDWTMEGKTVFCGIVSKLHKDDGTLSITVEIDPNKIYTAHLIYGEDGVGNAATKINDGISNYKSYDIVLDSSINNFARFTISYSGYADSYESGGFYDGYNKYYYTIKHNGSTLLISNYGDTMGNDKGAALLIIKEHDPVIPSY